MVETLNRISHIQPLEKRRSLRETTINERQNLTGWYPFHSEDPSSYDLSFKRVLGETAISDLLKDRKAKGRTTFVLDVMSPGNILRGLSKLQPLDGGVSITLGDGRTHLAIERDSASNLSVIEGNILLKRTWRKAQEWIDQQGVDGFDLIMCRAVGGFDSIPINDDLYYYLLNRAWVMLSGQRGIILTQIPIGCWKVGVGEWVENINMIQGIEAVYGPKRGDEHPNEFIPATLKMIKSHEAPSTLPVVLPFGRAY